VAPAAPRSPRPAEAGAPATEAADETLRVNVGLLETLMNLAGELVLSRNQLRAAVAQNNQLLLNTANQRVNQVTSELQDVIMQTRLQPVGNVFLKFPRMVRDLSRTLNKEIQLEIQGKEVALDKTLIEGLSDPLTHMVRNAVDHGVETTAERVAAGKSPAGLVRIEARHEAGQVVIEISDDGKGIDPEKITEAAVRKGLLTAEKAATLSERDRQALIFLPGLSTAKVLSDVSGRGVGMDVVKTNLDRLGGQVEIHSVVGRGSTFRIKLPLTLAIIPSLIVTLRDERFAIPQANIEELLRLQPAEVAERIEIVGDTEVLLLRDRVLPLVRLEQVLGAAAPAGAGAPAAPQALEIAVVTTGITSFGLVVGAYHDTEEVVVKPLGRRFQRLREYAGATILGDGALALILDTAGIAAKCSLTAAAEDTRAADRGATQRQQDQQMLLLFHNGPGEPCAIPLDLVQRLERIEARQVERLGHQRTMQYRGSSLPLVTLGDAAQVGALDESRDLVVLVTHEHGRDVGLLCNMPVDVLETAAALDRATHRQRGIAGSVILHERTTLVADLREIIGAVHPEWAAEATPAPAASSAPRLAAAPGGGMTVLLAEDSDFFRAQVKRYLEEDGMQVLAAPDGEAAWNLLLQNLDAVRAVVTDIEMPQLNGLQLAHRIRVDQRTAKLPVIAVSSLAGEEDIARGKAAGVSEYQFKLDREKLLASVHAYLGR
jgi:two-component system chemotaxis sensor kinase CheA